jgi:hypothetical protein
MEEEEDFKGNRLSSTNQEKKAKKRRKGNLFQSGNTTLGQPSKHWTMKP